jgi:hypothetical protein
MALAVMLGRDVGDSVDTSMQHWNTATQILCIVAMTVFFGLRVYTRIYILNGFGKEDCAWSIIA